MAEFEQLSGERQASLDSAQGAPQLQAIVSSLSTATQKIRKDNETLEKKLELSTREIARLIKQHFGVGGDRGRIVEAPEGVAVVDPVGARAAVVVARGRQRLQHAVAFEPGPEAAGRRRAGLVQAVVAVLRLGPVGGQVDRGLAVMPLERRHIALRGGDSRAQQQGREKDRGLRH